MSVELENLEPSFEWNKKFITIKNHKWIILFFSFLIPLMTTLFLSVLPSIYQATTTILIESQQPNIIAIEKIYGQDSGKAEYYASQMGILRSRKVAEQVISNLKLVEIKEFNPSLNNDKFNYKKWLPEWFYQFLVKKTLIKPDKIFTNEYITNIVITNFIKKLDIAPRKNSQLADIKFESQSPQLAMQVTMEIANTFIKNSYNFNKNLTDEAIKWLTEKLKTLKNNLDKSHKKLVLYRTNENLLDIRGVQTLDAREIDSLSSRLIDSKRSTNQIRSTYNLIKSIQRPTILQYESIPGILEDISVQNAKRSVDSAYSTVTELSSRYLYKHPKMQVALASYKKAKISYAMVLKNTIKRIEKQYFSAQENQRFLKDDLELSKNRIRKININSSSLQELERNVQADRQLYDAFLKRYLETKETSGIQSANARIVDPADIPNKPIRPKKKIILLISLFLGLCLGLIIAFTIELLNKTIRSASDVEKLLKIPLLGVLPKLKIKKANKNQLLLPFIDDERSDYSESIRTICTSILLSKLEQDSQILLVTSSIPDEGKTTFVLNLSIALGKMERVLLIDADLRKASISKMCKIHGEKGISTLIMGKSEIDDTIHHFEDWNIDVLPTGRTSSNYQELLGSKQFKKLLDGLSKQYDTIIIDSVPVLAVSDTLLISKYIDNTLYIIKADDTDKLMIQAGLDQLKKYNIPVIGVVLNQLDFNKANSYDGGYYNNYYNSYGY